MRLMAVAVGWATAEFVLTKSLPLWVGARGMEFDWKYTQSSLDANIALVSISLDTFRRVSSGIVLNHGPCTQGGIFERELLPGEILVSTDRS